MAIEYEATCPGGKVEMVALFNEDRVSEECVREWLTNDGIGYNQFVITMLKSQYEMLIDIVEPNPEKTKDFAENSFYEDLALEQQGGII
jgi:hypothetical protein